VQIYAYDKYLVILSYRKIFIL